MSKIEVIYIAPQAQAPVVSVSAAILMIGRGIVGDRYFKKQ